MAKPLSEWTDDEIEAAARGSRAMRALSALMGEHGRSEVEAAEVRRVLAAAEAAGVADDAMRAKAEALIAQLSAPQAKARELQTDELTQELRLHREAVEKAAREAESRHFRETAMAGFRRIADATRKSAAAGQAGAQALRPVSHADAHEAAVLKALSDLGFDPLRLPPRPPGRVWQPKRKAREALAPRMSEAVFKKAWVRLCKAARIAEA